MREARQACPLNRKSDRTYSFIHKSFQDYLAVRQMYLVLKTKDEDQVLEAWNYRYLTEERLILEFIGELVREDKDRVELEAILLKIVKRSRKQGLCQVAASNALSVLNWNNYIFSRESLRKIQAPKAYLSNGNFYGTDLRKANLRESEVVNINLAYADLRKSDLRDVYFGELPYLEHTDRLNCHVLNQAGDLLLVGDDSGCFLLFRYPSGECIWQYYGHECGITSVAFSPDGQQFATGSADKEICLWSVENKSLIHIFNEHANIVSSIAFSPDKQYLASGSLDKTIRLWSLENKTLVHMFEGHKSGVQTIAFSPDGQHFVSGGKDKTIRVWSVENKTCVKVLRGFNDGIKSVAFHPFGLAVGSYNKGVYFFKLPKDKFTKEISLQLAMQTQAYLQVDEANIEEAQIDEMNLKLLQQRGAKRL